MTPGPPDSSTINMGASQVDLNGNLSKYPKTMIQLLIVIIYIAFISLGLPDSVLGSVWPTLYVEMDVPVSFSGIISMTISMSTILSSLLSDRLTRKFGAGLVTATSIVLTALALLGFSFSTKFWMLCIFAIPYGLGAGGVDAALNNYVALHYSSRHMSWLHCMWGVGAILGPTIMGAILTNGQGWQDGYRYLNYIQIALSAIVFLSLPLWRKKEKLSLGNEPDTKSTKPLTLKQIFTTKGALSVFITFFCYCALESTAMLWSSSYLVLHNGVSEERAALFGSMFFIGMTVGRAINGFATIKLDDTTLIRIGSVIILVGGLLLFIPAGEILSIVAIIVIGLGCAPIYPCIIHSTPIMFGKDKSQALIGMQMAFAYLGSCFMPPLFGVIANNVSISIMPIYILFFLVLMIIMHEVLVKKTKFSKYDNNEYKI